MPSVIKGFLLGKVIHFSKQGRGMRTAGQMRLRAAFWVQLLVACLVGLKALLAGGVVHWYNYFKANLWQMRSIKRRIPGILSVLIWPTILLFCYWPYNLQCSSMCKDQICPIDFYNHYCIISSHAMSCMPLHPPAHIQALILYLTIFCLNTVPEPSQKFRVPVHELVNQ